MPFTLNKHASAKYSQKRKKNYVEHTNTRQF